MDLKPNKQLSISEARRSLPSLVHTVEKGEPVELTRRGKPVAVLLSSKEFAALTDKVPDLFPAIRSFRASADLDTLDVEEVYGATRDRSPGRKSEF